MKSLKTKAIAALLFLIMVLAGLVPVLTGCAGTIDVDTSGMLLVVYDGNGGYLGNKTATVRKMFCSPNSKIPSYPTEYTEDQYTVSSLGLAMREGYNLMGWYASDDAKYFESENGEYVYLDTADGNGIFEIDPNGEYVRKYQVSDNGEFIFVPAQESQVSDEEGAVPDTFVFINNKVPVETEEPEDVQEDAVTEDSTEETDETAPEESEDVLEPDETEETEEVTETEEYITLSVDSGFYICNGEETIIDIDDDYLREAYQKAYDTKTYTAAQVAAVSGWQKYDDLADDFKTLFADLDKYDYAFAPAEDGDQELEHYAIVSGYASLYSIFVENDKGAYVFESPDYVLYDENNPAHENAQRYTMNDKYVFGGNEESASFLPRYDASMDYWDFSTDTVTEDKCKWDGEKYVLTLNAHWTKKNTVYYHYENALGQVDESWTRLLADNITYVSLKPGEVIGKKEIIPLKAGSTFVCWSKTQGEYDPWDFENEVFPEGESELHLYAYYVEGEYTRIVSASGLAGVGKNPAGNYLLVNDIDLGGKEISGSPLGLTDKQAFTGEFIAFDKTIKNFTYKMAPSKQQSMDTSIVTMGCLFPEVNGATISGVNVECNAVFSGLKAAGRTPASKTEVNFALGGIAGKITAGADTLIKDCNVTMALTEKSAGALESDAFTYVVHYGAVSAYKAGSYANVEGCTSAIDNGLDATVVKLVPSEY